MRIVWGIPFLLISILVLAPFLIVLLGIYSILSMILEIALGRRIRTRDTIVGRGIKGLYDWVMINLTFVISGDGTWQLLPRLERS